MSTFQSIIVKGAYFCILINKIYFIIKVVKVFLHLLTVLLLVINELFNDVMLFR